MYTINPTVFPNVLPAMPSINPSHTLTPDTIQPAYYSSHDPTISPTNQRNAYESMYIPNKKRPIDIFKPT